MKVSFHGPISTSGIIRQANADLYNIGADSDTYIETVKVTPDPLSTIGLADSDFGFNIDVVDSA